MTNTRAIRTLFKQSAAYFKQYQLSEASTAASVAIKVLKKTSFETKNSAKMQKVLNKLQKMLQSVDQTLNRAVQQFNASTLPLLATMKAMPTTTTAVDIPPRKWFHLKVGEIRDHLFLCTLFENVGDQRRALVEVQVLAHLLHKYVRPPRFNDADERSNMISAPPTDNDACEFACALLDLTNKFAPLKLSASIARDVIKWFVPKIRDGNDSNGASNGASNGDNDGNDEIIVSTFLAMQRPVGHAHGECSLTLRTFLTIVLGKDKDKNKNEDNNINHHSHVSLGSRLSPRTLVEKELSRRPSGQSISGFDPLHMSRARLAPFSLLSRRRRSKPVVLGTDDISLSPFSQCSIDSGWNASRFGPNTKMSLFLTSTVGTDRHISIVDGSKMTAQEFYENFVSQGKPVLLRGLTNSWKASSCGKEGAWSRESLEKRFGTHLLSSSSSSDTYALQSFGRDKDGSHWFRHMTTLSEYLHRLERTRRSNRSETTTEKETEKEKEKDEDPLYTFVELKTTTKKDQILRTVLDKDFDHPPIFDPPLFPSSISERNRRALFGIGAAGSGVYFHKHSSTWRALVHGKTKWYLYPPGSHIGKSFGTMREWLADERARSKKEDVVRPLEIVQNAGDILYLPDLWMHATVNLQFSISIAVEVGFYRELFGG